MEKKLTVGYGAEGTELSDLETNGITAKCTVHKQCTLFHKVLSHGVVANNSETTISLIRKGAMN